MNSGTLAGVRVVDLTDERAIYGAKLMADLGADVIRPEPVAGDELRQRGPHVEGDDPDHSSLYYAFFASSRRTFRVDADDADSIAALRQLIECAHIVMSCRGSSTAELVDLPALITDDQIWVDVSSFGDDGPWSEYLAPDLIAGALGGSVATTGDVDTPPLKCFGELNFMVSGAYAGIAALAGLHALRNQNIGQRISVPVHECIASCLEQVFMFYWYHATLERDPVLPRRGATHWSDAFTVMNGRNGSIMITPTPDFDRQLAWLVEENAHDDLFDEKYQDPANLRELIMRTMQLLAQWVSEKDVEALFFEAQERRIPYGWVQPLERLAENPQLDARDWFVPLTVGGRQINASGAPYRFSASTWQMTEPEEIALESSQVLSSIGWSSE